MLETLVCNDIQESRIKKLHYVMSEYIYDYQSWGSRLKFTQINARNIDEPDTYNKVNIYIYINHNSSCIQKYFITTLSLVFLFLNTNICYLY